MKTLIISILAATALVSGCATNPVTGKKEFSIVSEQQELEIGKQQYAPLRQAQGGDYNVDHRLTAYVSEVGRRLAQVSDRKLPYEFKVLNSSVPNAWALPGGKISINRGLLTELGSEAELAAVLGHEITHAAARHGARSMSRGLLVQGAMLGAVIASQGKDYAQLAQIGASVGAQLITTKYGRDAERESDLYGMQYMSRAGYDPQGAVDLQKTFVRLSEGKNQDWLSGLFASHPPSMERVENNIKTAAGLPKSGETGRTQYQAKIAQLVRSKPAYDAYDDAREAFADNDFSKARSLVNKAVSLEPREGHFHALLGDLDFEQNRFQSAKAHYNRAINNNAEFFYYYVQRGVTNEKLHYNPQAKQDLEKSLELLPTADAYNSLGNIAKAEKNPRKAKEYYAKAAKNNSEAGKSAYASLVDMDIVSNPSSYVGVRLAQNNSGGIVAQISNPTPRNLGQIVLTISYQDNSGRSRQMTKPLSGSIAAETKEQINLGLRGLSAAQLQTLQAAVIQARVVR